MFTISLNPTYLCNLRCTNCYLTTAQLSDPQKLDITQAQSLIREVCQTYNTTHIDIYGGEITALPPQYQMDLLSAIREVYHGPINIVTNYLKQSPIQNQPGVTLSVSYDFQYRQHHDVVYERLKATTTPIHLLVLATADVISNDVDDMIVHLNQIPHLDTVEIKPYSSNQANQHTVTHEEYERFIKQWITSPIQKQFTLTNSQLLQQSVVGLHNSMSNDHIYITPSGKYAVLEFDLNDNEYFKELDTLEEYAKWCNLELSRTHANTYCNQCEFMGHCLTEHMRIVKSVEHSCNGYFKLLRWYKNEAMENSTSNIP